MGESARERQRLSADRDLMDRLRQQFPELPEEVLRGVVAGNYVDLPEPVDLAS